MAPSAVLLVSLTLCALAAAAPRQEYGCRRSEEVTRCTDAPNDQLQRGGHRWCEYRVCAFAFVPAAECAPDVEARATHRCARARVQSAMWRCKPGVAHDTFVLPDGCRGDECRDNVKACACETVSPERFHYEPVRPSTAQC